MSKKAFEKIAAGLNEVLDCVRRENAMTKLEQVARAITEEIGMQRVDPFSAAKFSGINPPIEWDRVARAAVEALRQPTLGVRVLPDHISEVVKAAGLPPGRVAFEVWQAMLDAILSEKPE